MRMISYAQNQEDVLLDRAFPRGVPGMYIDVGAFDPVVASVTKHFYDLGWRGINAEPAAGPFERLRAARDRDVNLNVGLSSAPGTLTLYESPAESGWSTFEAGQAAWHRDEGLDLTARSVAVRTLRDVCEEFVDGTVDFVSVDVEGHEREVLEGGDWDRWRPRVVLVEATQPGTAIPAHDAWEPILLKADYAFVAFDGLNRYYVRGEEAAQLAPAFQSPANVLDDYVPYAHHKQVEDLRNALGSNQRIVAAARAVNEAQRAESAGYREELEFLRSEYRRLDVVLAQTRGRYEAAMVSLRDTRVLHDQLAAEIRAVRADMEALLVDLGPTTVKVARSITRTARRMPGMGGAVGVARSVKRRLPGSR
jgi:FkbM family methyltransferase